MCVGVDGSDTVVVSSELGGEGIGMAHELWKQTRHPTPLLVLFWQLLFVFCSMFKIVRSLSLHRSMREREREELQHWWQEERRGEMRRGCVANCCFGDKKMDKGEGERGADGLPQGNISISRLPIELGLGFEAEKPTVECIGQKTLSKLN